MEYIDKQKEKSKLHALLDDFLERYSQSGKPFPADMYDALKADRNNGMNTFQHYSETMLEENECRCCYCMRTIRENPLSHRFHVTLDHVIPNSVDSQADYDEYYRLPSELEKNDMTLTANFVKSQQWPPYPHRIAYENLVPTCLGTFPDTDKQSMTCNIKRGDSFVHPLVFRKTINNEIKYYNDGTVEWTADPGDGKDGKPHVNLLGLNFIDLRFVRCAWFYILREGLSYDIVNSEHLFRVMEAELDDDEKDSKELLESLKKFKTKEYWELLSDFQYFNNKSRFTQR